MANIKGVSNKMINILNYMDDKSKTLTTDNYEQVMSELYCYVKYNLAWFLSDVSNNPKAMFVRAQLDKILDIEKKYGKDSLIIDFNIPFSIENKTDEFIKSVKNGSSIYDLIRESIPKKSDNNEMLDFIVKEARKSIITENFELPDTSNLDLGDFDFSNLCYPAAEHINLLCAKHSIENERIIIYSGFGELNEIKNNFQQHHATFVTLNGRSYLVDVTYSQFFIQYINNLDRLGLIGLSGSYVGSYMMIDKDRLDLAIKLIRDGYVELTDGVLKMYMDGFALSFRNALFYENNNISSFSTEYTDGDYLRFLYSDDSQIKHEGKENLGYQLKPLKNPYLDFRSFIK